MLYCLFINVYEEITIESYVTNLSNQFKYFSSWAEILILFFFLFCIGLTGIIFNYQNYLVTMLCVEIMYLGITICFLIVSLITFDPKGKIYSLLLLILAASESAVGLGILIVLYRFGKAIDFLTYQTLKG